MKSRAARAGLVLGCAVWFAAAGVAGDRVDPMGMLTYSSAPQAERFLFAGFWYGVLMTAVVVAALACLAYLVRWILKGE